ncbi:MAG: oligopeptide transporter, OPT family [bacterium]
MKKGEKEFTPQAIILGIVLALVMCAANTYLGLYAGMTVSASIPAAVISMGILRGLLRRGTILENNIVQTIASSGESLAAGIIFTVPALVITGVWDNFKYWETTLIAVTGGVLGILFMIPMRRVLIVEEKGLKYPEGVACAEVLDAGDTGGAKVAYVFISLAIGAIFKFLVAGITLIRGVLEWTFQAGKGVFYFGSDVSPALFGVGYIVGFNIASLVFIGGCIGWVVAIPVYSIFGSGADAAGADLLNYAWTMWSTQVRYMGVGAMAVGGIWSIISVRSGIVRGVRELIAGFKLTRSTEKNEKDLDIPSSLIIALIVLTVAAIFFLYLKIIGSPSIGALSTAAVVISSFFFVAVASYIVGLVGSSNSPVSGMTICAVLLTGLMLSLFGITGTSGILSTLCVAGVVCGAICSAGDISQDLKTGYLVGASPRKQQLGELIGAIVPAFIIAPILVVLHTSYGIGTGAAGALKAPQASLFAGITKAIFGQSQLPWLMVLAGIGISIAIIVIDAILKKAGSGFRLYVMPVAVGIYLPLSLSVPIFIGGIIAYVTRNLNPERGVLCASGLIAGEAITGILIGTVIYFNKNLLPITVNAPLFVTFFAAIALVLGLFIISGGKFFRR